MVADTIKFLVSNFTLPLFVLGLIAAGIQITRHHGPRTGPVVIEALLSWLMFFSYGVSYFYNFVFHTFFGEMAARFIGWADSPFQLEVGAASLGISLIGFLAWRGSFDMRLATILSCACFLWGAAVGHMVQMAETGNFAAGNAGVIFYTDLLLPVVSFILLWLSRKPAPAR
jgi:hypothetical protein